VERSQQTIESDIPFARQLILEFLGLKDVGGVLIPTRAHATSFETFGRGWEGKGGDLFLFILKVNKIRCLR